MANRVVTTTEFKANCLALLDEVASTGGSITVTKRGKPLVTLDPVPKKPRLHSTEGILKGRIHISDELLNAGLSDPRGTARR
jgi:prevent-host-death family protein